VRDEVRPPVRGDGQVAVSRRQVKRRQRLDGRDQDRVAAVAAQGIYAER
jgi:hypothetical protein